MRARIAALTLLTLAFAPVLAACGGEEPAPQPPPPPPPPPQPTASASAPPADTTPPPPPKPSLSELIPGTLKSVNEAFSAHDPQKLLSFFTDDASITGYGPAHTKSDAAAAMQGFFTAFSDAKMAPLRVWVKGNVAIVEDAWAGTMTGDFMGQKATNKPVGEQLVQVYTFNDDGQIKQMNQYADSGVLMAQIKKEKNAPAAPVLPTNPPEVHTAKGTPDEDKLADLGKATDATFSKHDVKAVIDGVADDADFWMNISGQPATKGKKALTKELTDWFKAFPDQAWTTTNAWGIDGFAILEHTLSGTQKGALGPVKASNKPVTSWHFLHIYQPTADGKMQHGWAYANTGELLMQTGALKKPSEAKADVPAAAAKGGAKPAPKK